MAGIEELWFHAQRPRPGDVVLDVGAGRGVATRFFSDVVGSKGRVFGIEPHPRVFAELEQRIRVDALSNARALRYAISDRDGFGELTDLENDENNTIRSRAGTGLRVETRTLDTLMDELDLSRVDFVKMNIEGAEQLAVTTMNRALHSARALVIACHDFVADLNGDDWFRTKSVVSAALEAHGFVIGTRASDPRVFVRDYVYAHRE